MEQADKDPAVLEAIKKILKRVKTEYERHRHYAKTVNFGIPYGRTKFGMAKGLNMTPDEAQAIIDTYFEANTQIKEWLERTARIGLVKWYVETSIGRKRFFTPLKPGSYERRRWINSYRRAMGNMPIQGGGADITKLAMVKIDKRLREEGLDAFIVMTIHDEIVCEADEAEAEAVLRVMTEEMVAAGDYVLKGLVPVEVDAKISDTWTHV
jgi:DNA polymerase-1